LEHETSKSTKDTKKRAATRIFANFALRGLRPASRLRDPNIPGASVPAAKGFSPARRAVRKAMNALRQMKERFPVVQNQADRSATLEISFDTTSGAIYNTNGSSAQDGRLW